MSTPKELSKVDRKKLHYLRVLVLAGVKSGIAEDFSFEKLTAELDAEAKREKSPKRRYRKLR